MNLKEGQLYAIGVGPGDKELVSVKAVRLLQDCAVVAAPISRIGGESLAYEIVKEYIPADKEILFAYFPMTMDQDVVQAAWADTADKLRQYLQKGKSVALLTLGDVALYSTAAYITKMLKESFSVTWVPGITSVSACACRLGFSLGQNKNRIVILPGSDLDCLEELADGKANIVIMKPGKNVLRIKAFVRQYHLEDCFYAISNCGMENEKIFSGIDELPAVVDYFSVFFIMVE